MTSLDIDGDDGYVGTNNKIAVYQELGTRTIPPRSFLRGAVIAKEHEVVEAGLEGPPWSENNSVRAGQELLIDGKNIFAGPDTDTLVSGRDRYDGLHFSKSGQETFAARWVEILTH